MKLEKIKAISVFLIIALIITFIPQGVLHVSADDDVIEETTEIETDNGEEDEDELIIDDSFMQEIVPPGADASINSWLDQPSLYEPIGSGLTYLPDGVYAITNIGNAGYCVGVLNDSTDAGSTAVQVFTTSATTDFDRSCLFKITRVGTTTRYVIRSMLNNRLILSYNSSTGKVVTKEVSPNDADVNAADTFTILANPSGGYAICPYGTIQVIAAPNSTASDNSSAALIRTTSASAGNRGRWQFSKYIGAAKSGYSMSSSVADWTYGFKLGENYTLKLKTWSTEIGANTPYLTVHSNYANMATYSWNATNCTMSMTPTKEGPVAIQIAIRMDGTTTAFYSITSTYTIVPDLDGHTALIQNVGTGRYIDLENSSMAEGAIIQQWAFHTGTQAQWIFEVGIGGLFYIKSRRSGLYVGVDPSNTTSVKQYSTQNSYTRWRLKKTSSGNFALYCYATESSGLVLSTPSNTSGNGADLTMLAYVDDANYRDEWNVYHVNYYATINNYYDSGYFIRYSESEATSNSVINSYISTISQVYLKTLGLLIYSSTAQYYHSSIDQCKGTTTSANIDTLCSHSGIIHTDRSNVISDFNLQTNNTANNTTTNVLWTCHKIKSIASNGQVNYNRSCSSGQCIYILEISSANDRATHSQGVLLHELNHQYGAKDHYHEEDANGNCKFSDICSECGANPRPKSCIMADARQDINSPQIICSECKQDIIKHLENHHSY